MCIKTVIFSTVISLPQLTRVQYIFSRQDMQRLENQDFHLHDDHANGQKYPRTHLPGVEMTIFDLRKKLYPDSKSFMSC